MRELSPLESPSEHLKAPGTWGIMARIEDMDIDGVYASLNFPSALGFGGVRLTMLDDPERQKLSAVGPRAAAQLPGIGTRAASASALAFMAPTSSGRSAPVATRASTASVHCCTKASRDG